MIILVTGKLGSGKTFFAVNYLLKKYYVEDEFFIDPVAKGDVRIVTNIEGLKLPHERLDDLVYEEGSYTPDIGKMEKVFSNEFVAGLKNVVYVIDEAQIYFDRKFYNKKVFSFFQKSRHAGVDIILITQDINTLAKEIKVLSEYEVRALQRSVRLRNTFMYQYFIDEEKFKSVNVKFRLSVANLYESRRKEEKERVSYVHYRFAAILLVSVCSAVLLFKFVLIDTLFPNKAKALARSQSSAVAREALPAERAPADERKTLVRSVRYLSPEEIRSELSRQRGQKALPEGANNRPDFNPIPSGQEAVAHQVAAAGPEVVRQRLKMGVVNGVTVYTYE